MNDLSAAGADVIDGLIAHPDAAVLRGLRPAAVAALQACHAAFFFSDDLALGPAGPTRADRFALAALVCEASGADAMAEIWRRRAERPADADASNGANVCEARFAAREAMRDFAARLADRPADRRIEGCGAPADRLLAAGLAPQDAVFVGMLVGFVACQLRVVTALGAMLRAAQAPALVRAWDTADAAAASRQAVSSGSSARALRSPEPVPAAAPAANAASAALGIGRWIAGPGRRPSWLPAVERMLETEAQRRMIALLCREPIADGFGDRAGTGMSAPARPPEGRAPLPGGDVRASRTEGRPVSAPARPPERARIAFAVALARDGGRLGVEAIGPLVAAGLGRLEMLDLIHAVALSAWVNRLRLGLGEPV